jgi:hypothetical protein
MRLFIFIFFTCKALLIGDEYTIQLMSYKHESSLTPYFMKIVQKTTLKSKIIKEDGYNKIIIGKFKSKTEAIKVCKSLKCIPPDSFVRKYPIKKIKPVSKSKRVIKKVRVFKSTPCSKKKQCNLIQQYKPRRECEIKEALDYLRDSGYYHFIKD